MKVHLLWLLFFLIFTFPSRASDFTTLDWQSDTTQLGITFSGAFYEEGSPFPRYLYEYDLGLDYTSRTYTVNVEYPEYQYMDIPAGMEEQVRSLPGEPLVGLDLQSSAHQGILCVDFVPFIYRNGRLMRLHSFRLVKSEGVAKRSLVNGISVAAQKQIAGEYTSNSVLAKGKWLKISIPKTGIYQLTDAKLKEMGFSDPSKVHLYGYGGALLSEKLEGVHPDDLCEMPAYRGNGRMLFYARGPLSWDANAGNTYFTRVQNFYATSGYYFLTESEGSPLSFPLREVTGTPAATVTTFSERVLHEEDAFNWAASGRELYEGYNYSNGNKRSYAFHLPAITQEAAHVAVTFAAKSESQNSVDVEINGESIGRFSISYVSSGDNYCKAQTGEFAKAWTTGQSENTSVTLTHNRSAGSAGRLNYIAINYRRRLKHTGNYLTFRDLATVGKVARYSLEGCDASTQVWDVTTPGEYAKMQGDLSGSVYSFTGDNTTLREYVAVNVNATYETPSVMGSVPNQNLHALEKPDMVIIIPSSAEWKDQAERLAEAHRQKDNMKVHVVTAAQVYNEFSSGTPDATAYRWLMKMFYDRAGGDFGSVYLLMMGDCSYDNRMLTSEWKKFSPDDFLLCYQSLPSTNELSSYVTDDYLGILATGKGNSLSTDKMDIGVGRFPVRNVEEARIAVDKTISYMNNKEMGSWKNRICYATDDEDYVKNGSNRFMEAAEKLAAYTEKNHPQFAVTRIYQDAFPRVATAAGFTYPQATKRLLSMIEEGCLMVNYTGHGGTNGWSAEFLLTASHIRAMRNERLSLWVTATCDFCRYDDVSYSAGEEAFLNGKGGAVALFTTSRVVNGYNNDNLNQQFIQHIFSLADGKRLRLGDIMRLSKNALRETNKLSFSLIGDPALALAFPDHKVVLESLNGKEITEPGLQLRAGDVVTLKGHIEDASGVKNTSFNGLVQPTVFDRKEHVVGYNYAGLEYAFEFDQYNSKLFSGSDSVRAGSFEISFPVPLDISYSNEKGMINLYASSNEGVEGQGAFDNFTVGGTAPGALETDSLGPDIWLYLNTPDFQAGGVVNPNPFLYVELVDEEGINATGNGIGHDLMATIDNSPLYSFVLNEYFKQAPGGYSRGTIQYQFSELPEGDHTLYFTAWDTKNNSSTYQLPFRVEAGEAPLIAGLSCYPVPAATDLTFHFNHNRPGTNLAVTIEVFTFSGACVWQHVLTDQTSSGYYSYTWNLTTEGGRRLPTGVYLYRARFSTDGSDEATETLKFVVADP